MSQKCRDCNVTASFHQRSVGAVLQARREGARRLADITVNNPARRRPSASLPGVPGRGVGAGNGACVPAPPIRMAAAPGTASPHRERMLIQYLQEAPSEKSHRVLNCRLSRVSRRSGVASTRSFFACCTLFPWWIF